MYDVLHLVHRVPYPPDKGDRIRTYQMLRFMARRARVHLACLADEPVTANDAAELKRLCARVAVIPITGRLWLSALGALATGRTVSESAFHSAALRKLLTAWGRTTRFHAFLVSASSLAPYLQLPPLADVPTVVDFMDVDSQKWLDYAALARGPRGWLYGREGHRLRRLEARLAEQVRAITLVSDAEAAIFRRFCQAGNVHVIANGVDLDYFQPLPARVENGCVFVGALDYRPNVDGICWFVREVWPAIRRRRPDCTLTLVGRRPAPAVRQLADSPGVWVIGQVPDVRPYVAQAAVVVVPLRIARGLQNKVLEALAMGKATVASPPALAALATQPGAHLLSAAAPEEWVDAIERLLADADWRKRLGEAGRRFVEEHHQWERCLAPLAGLLDLPATCSASQ